MNAVTPATRATLTSDAMANRVFALLMARNRQKTVIENQQRAAALVAKEGV